MRLIRRNFFVIRERKEDCLQKPLPFEFSAAGSERDGSGNVSISPPKYSNGHFYIQRKKCNAQFLRYG